MFKIPYFIGTNKNRLMLMEETQKQVGLTGGPEHIAIIMDGNGRWAKKRNLSRTQGHIEGVRRVEEIIDYANLNNVKVLTLFTFSTENWSRPENEVSMIMNILVSVLDKKAKKLVKDNIRFQTIGRTERIPDVLLKTINSVVEKTKNNTGLIMNLAFNYGGRLEIVDAVRKIAHQVAEGGLAINDINEQVISDNLYTAGLQDPDLLIRTSGEQRISNFLLWQLSYAEFFFSEKMWPDFTVEEFKNAISNYRNRERRYGNLVEKGVGDE